MLFCVSMCRLVRVVAPSPSISFSVSFIAAWRLIIGPVWYR